MWTIYVRHLTICSSAIHIPNYKDAGRKRKPIVTSIWYYVMSSICFFIERESRFFFLLTMDQIDRNYVFSNKNFNIVKFATNAYYKFNNTYILSEVVIKELEKKYCVEKIGLTKNNYEYIINHNNKTALVPAFFGALLNKCPGDVFKRARNPSAAQIAVRFFLKKYPKYTIAISLGSIEHELCVFIRRDNSNQKFHAIVYDSYNDATHNVLRNFVKSFGNRIIVSGYNNRKYNDDGWCSAYAWHQIYEFLTTRINAFSHPDRYNIKPYNKRYGRIG